MSIVHFAYLFDSRDFLSEVVPIIKDLDNNNYQPLRQKAWITTQEKPYVWEILEKHFYGLDDFMPEYEDAQCPNTRFWFLTILSQFLHPIPSFRPIPTWQDQCLYWNLLKKGLSVVGWSEFDCALLVSGISTCSLVLPDRVEKLLDQGSIGGLIKRSAWIESQHEHWQRTHWCDFGGGWLNQKEIERLCAKLFQSHDEYLALYKHPEVLQNWEKDFRVQNVNALFVLLQASYEDALKMLATAKESAKCLFMMIS